MGTPLKTLSLRSASIVIGLLACGCDISSLVKVQGSGTSTKGLPVSAKIMPLSIQNEGSFSGRFDPSNKTSQSFAVTDSTSSLAGMKLDFAPGSLAISTIISLNPSNSIVSSALASEIGAEASTEIQSVSSAITLSSSVSLDALNPFSLSIPVASTALRLTSDPTTWVIVYRIYVASTNKYKVGYYSQKDISVQTTSSGFLVKFFTSSFGTFEVAAAGSLAGKESASAESAIPVTSKSAERFVEPAKWESLSLVYDNDLRTIAVTAKTTGPALAKCVLVFSPTKQRPYTYAEKASAQSFGSSIPKDVSGSLYWRLECLAETGSTTLSEWQGPIEVKAAASNATSGTAASLASPAIEFSSSSFTFTKATAITTQTPSNSGGTIASCTISPSLPEGLSFNSENCSFSGTATTIAATANYTITATNVTGSSSVTVTITVQDVLPALSFDLTSYTKKKTDSISIVPNSTAGAITNCTISPSLPSGLSLSTSTCGISGTPSVSFDLTSLTLTPSNGTGNGAAVTISLKIIGPYGSGDDGSRTVSSSIDTSSSTLIGSGKVLSASRRVTAITSSSPNYVLTLETTYTAPSDYAVDDEVLWVVIGAGTSSSNCSIGRYGFARVAAVTDNSTSLTIDSDITVSSTRVAVNASATTTATFCLVQVVRVPNFSGLTINSSTTLSATAFSRTTGLGGIIVMRVNGTLTLNGTISAAAMGFEAGNSTCTSNQCKQGDGNNAAGTATRTANGNGGGGGFFTSRGGGGGANHGAGGAGNLISSLTATGGTANTAFSADTYLMFGGAGGGSGTTALGGRGGGIIVVVAKTMTGAGLIASGGENGSTNAWSSGGGGAGGTVLLITHDPGTTAYALNAGGAAAPTEDNLGGGAGGGKISNFRCSSATANGSSSNNINGGSGENAGGAGNYETSAGSPYCY